jgi:hypothetical protein
MATKLPFLILFLLASCGKEVQLTSNKLESYNSVTNAEAVMVDKTGTLTRKNITNSNDRVTTGGQTLIVSKFSSFQAFNAINSRAEGISVGIKYKGEIKGPEIVLEIIEFQ